MASVVPRKYFEDGPAPEFGAELVTRLKALCPHIFLVCFRDKNQNVMIYQARVADGKLLDPPVESYWLVLEPSYLAARRKSGIVHDREEQSFLDRKFAWGYGATRLSDTEASFHFKNFANPMTVKVSPKGSKLFSVIDGRKYFLRTIFVKASENIKLLNIRDNLKSLCINGLDVTAKPYLKAKLYLKGGP